MQKSKILTSKATVSMIPPSMAIIEATNRIWMLVETSPAMNRTVHNWKANLLPTECLEISSSEKTLLYPELLTAKFSQVK
jgi:hypothetical protein